MLTQLPLQSVPLLHWQVLFEQYCPVPQLRPQIPQFAVSFWVLTQLPLQSVPLLHWQLPFEQNCPLAQL